MTSVSCLPFVVEIIKTVKHDLHLLDWSHQVGDPEVVGAWLLLETASRNSHDASLVNHVHAVTEIGLDALLMGLVDELLREVNTWESVHGAFDFCAGDILHVVERRCQELGFVPESTVQHFVLTLVKFDSLSRLTLEAGRISHQLNSSLTDSIRAQLNRFELKHGGFSLWCEVVGLEVASAETTLAHHALGD